MIYLTLMLYICGLISTFAALVFLIEGAPERHKLELAVCLLFWPIASVGFILWVLYVCYILEQTLEKALGGNFAKIGIEIIEE